MWIETPKQLRGLAEGTILQAFYSEDGEHCMATGDLISYTPAGNVEFVVIKKGNTTRFRRVDGTSSYEYIAQELLENFDNGIQLIKKGESLL
ncbi:hypothetical protein ABOUO_80 [Brevibacillus phage Abouo]|uniref:Uncharacterized protein n=1 Tax=Brevibacillus phage Abouo TaxID=1296661 RepID=S5MAA3_9CAUD|nr:hypothetical protein AVV45_gp80 [Brevibacillus phage Abouo]AGR47508.1 hypothetical protein ABOUO_80 [Brevibacillus phage Abouo]